jgi:hypothetical protein
MEASPVELEAVACGCKCCKVEVKTKISIKSALQLGLMQYLNWGICTISWRAVAQANIMASVITDTTLATLNFFVIRNMVKNADDTNSFIPWMFYTVGGVLGTISGVYASLYLLGK